MKVESAIKEKNKVIEVYDRHSQEKFIEVVYGEQAMRLFYGNALGAKITSHLLTNKFLSNVYGAYNDSSLSRNKIEAFATLLNINVQECEKELNSYESFNDFFARKLKPNARNIDTDPRAAICPSDGRLLVFPKLNQDTLSFVKWAPIKLVELFDGNEALVDRYKDGACAILRLCPSDYHRFHFAMGGKVGISKIVKGILHSVNPYALERKIPVYCLNKRTICEVETESAGRMVMMEVGALFVGSIVQTYRAGSMVKKGDEKGYFKFGGSTSIIFFEKDKMEWSEDLIKNSAEGVETYVKMGERIGTAFV